MLERIKEEIAVVFDRDPAARTTWEVVTCYPGFHALLVPSLVEPAVARRLKWLARFVSHIARWLTGIEIHPGATHRTALLHRSRHGGGDRRDGGNRRRLHALSRRDPGRHFLESWQAPSDPGQGGDRRAPARRSSGRSWWATAPRSVPTRWSSRRFRPARPRSASPRASWTRYSPKGPPSRRRSSGFSAYAVSGDMNDPMVKAVHQMLGHAVTDDQRIEYILEQLRAPRRAGRGRKGYRRQVRCELPESDR